MNVLAIDTASPVPAVALCREGRVYEESLPVDRRASERLLPALSEVLRAAGTSWRGCARIAVCSGPGSFTGVRVGLATAWGLARSLGLVVEAVPTLEALAEASGVRGGGSVAAVMDAGRGEVVAQVYELSASGGRARSLSPARRLPAAAAADLFRGRDVAALPPDILGFPCPALAISPARAVALAVARAPRDASGLSGVAIYARSSAAEEKLGAS